jgi:hypothetical protein
MCEEESFSDVRKACQLAEAGGELELYGLKIPLKPGKRDENFAHMLAYDAELTHAQNAIAWLKHWEVRNQSSTFHGNSAFPLLNARLRTYKVDLEREVDLFHVDADGRILLTTGTSRGAPFCHFVSDLFVNPDAATQKTKLVVAQEYLRNVVASVILAARREDLAYFARSMIFIVMKDDEPHVNVIDGSYDLFKLSDLLVDGRIGGPNVKAMIDCFSARVKEEQYRQSKLLSEFTFEQSKKLGNRAGKSSAPLFAHQFQVLERLHRSGKKIHNTTTTVIQGLGKHGQRR